jgi:xanthine dehydrogenase accessory factor
MGGGAASAGVILKTAMVEGTDIAVLGAAERSVREDGRVVLCQIVRAEGSTPGKLGWRLLVRRDGSAVGNLGGGAFEALVKTDALAKIVDRTAASELKRYYLTEEAVKGIPTGMVCGGMAEVFLEVLEAGPVLLICGGGPVGQALARAGQLAGFGLAVADDREAFRRPELFPAGTQIVAVDREYREDFLNGLGQRDLFVAIVSRCWETDFAALASLIRQEPPRLRYLGLMGSQRKIDRVVDELAARGVSFDTSRLHAPIGMAIGGDSPGEIAISILAEVIATRYAQAVD